MNAQQQLDRAMQAAHAGDYVSAINGLSKLIERMPEEGVVYQALGIVLLEADKPEDAALVLRKASELLGENAEVLQFLGVALAQSGQAAEAVSTLENAIEILGNRASSNVFLNLGNAK